MLESVLVDLHSLIETSVMAVEAINCSYFFGLCKPFIVEVNIVVNAVRKSSLDGMVLTQAMVAV